jgi:hypothetical protein
MNPPLSDHCPQKQTMLFFRGKSLQQLDDCIGRDLYNSRIVMSYHGLSVIGLPGIGNRCMPEILIRLETIAARHVHRLLNVWNSAHINDPYQAAVRIWSYSVMPYSIRNVTQWNLNLTSGPISLIRWLDTPECTNL